MNKQIILATAALLMSVATFAQKLGHTDGQSLLYSLPEMTTVSDELAKATKEYETELNTMKADYEAKVKEFEANRNSWPEAIMQSKVKAIQDLEQNMVDLENTANTDLSGRRDQMLKPLIDKVNNAIKELAVANGYTYIFDSGVGALLYMGGEDVTPQLREKLNIPANAPAMAAPPGGAPGK